MTYANCRNTTDLGYVGGTPSSLSGIFDGCDCSLSGTSSSTKNSVVRQFRSELSKAHSKIRELESAINKKYRTFDCNFNTILPSSCRGKLEEAQKLHKALNTLDVIALSPGMAPGDPKNTPVIFARPNDVVDAVTSIVSATAQQIKILSKWADRSDLEIYSDSFVDGMTDVLSKVGDVAAGVIGEAAAKTLKKAAEDMKKGKLPIMAIGVGVGGLLVLSYIVRSFK